MNKLKIVIDTNILVSSILIASSKADQAFKKAKKVGKILLSEMTLAELQEILSRPKFDRYVLLESLQAVYDNRSQIEMKTF
jgi:predicted nucleic acid-binding protein